MGGAYEEHDARVRIMEKLLYTLRREYPGGHVSGADPRRGVAPRVYVTVNGRDYEIRVYLKGQP